MSSEWNTPDIEGMLAALAQGTQSSDEAWSNGVELAGGHQTGPGEHVVGDVQWLTPDDLDWFR